LAAAEQGDAINVLLPTAATGPATAVAATASAAQLHPVLQPYSFAELSVAADAGGFGPRMRALQFPMFRYYHVSAAAAAAFLSVRRAA
jgi:hypothetical protein